MLRDASLLGNLFEAQLFAFHADESLLGRRQSPNCLLQSLLLFLLQDRGISSEIIVFGKAFGHLSLSKLLPSPNADAQILGGFDKQSFDVVSASPTSLQHTHTDFLHHIFGILSVAEETYGNTHHLVARLEEQMFKLCLCHLPI